MIVQVAGTIERREGADAGTAAVFNEQITNSAFIDADGKVIRAMDRRRRSKWLYGDGKRAALPARFASFVGIVAEVGYRTGTQRKRKLFQFTRARSEVEIRVDDLIGQVVRTGRAGKRFQNGE